MLVHAGAGSSATATRSVWEANLLKLLDQVGVKVYSKRTLRCARRVFRT